MKRFDLEPNYGGHSADRNGNFKMDFVFPLLRMPDAFVAETTAGHPLYGAIKHFDDSGDEHTIRLGKCMFERSRQDREGQKIVTFKFEAAEVQATIAQLDALRTKPLQLVLIDIDAGTEGSSDIAPNSEESINDNE